MAARQEKVRMACTYVINVSLQRSQSVTKVNPITSACTRVTLGYLQKTQKIGIEPRQLDQIFKKAFTTVPDMDGLPVDEVDPGEVGVGEGGREGDDPDDGDDLDGPAEARHGVLVEGVADGQVPLHREGHDCQN